MMARPEDINYIDVSPKQLVSVAAALIPFWKTMMQTAR
jgi:DNA-directed RNA polymerase subunit beta